MLTLLLRRFLEQDLVCVAVSAMEGVDVSGGGEILRLPRSKYGTSSVYHPTLRLWAIHVLAAKLSNQEEIYDRSPFILRVTPSLSSVYV